MKYLIGWTLIAQQCWSNGGWTVSKFVLEADIERAQIYLTLKAEDPVKHIQKLVGKRVTKAELKQLYPRVKHEIWVNQILPALKRKEIDRLRQTV